MKAFIFLAAALLPGQVVAQSPKVEPILPPKISTPPPRLGGSSPNCCNGPASCVGPSSLFPGPRVDVMLAGCFSPSHRGVCQGTGASCAAPYYAGSSLFPGPRVDVWLASVFSPPRQSSGTCCTAPYRPGSSLFQGPRVDVWLAGVCSHPSPMVCQGTGTTCTAACRPQSSVLTGPRANVSTASSFSPSYPAVSQAGSTIWPQPKSTLPAAQPKAVAQAPTHVEAELPPAPATTTKRYTDESGHEENYKWITGQLFYLHVDGGLWVVRYFSVGIEDRFGGSVVLASTVDMKNYREGDLVTVRGDMAGEGRASRSLGAPLYRPVSIEMVMRGD